MLGGLNVPKLYICRKRGREEAFVSSAILSVALQPWTRVLRKHTWTKAEIWKSSALEWKNQPWGTQLTYLKSCLAEI